MTDAASPLSFTRGPAMANAMHGTISAAKAGLREGDVLLAVGNLEVMNVKDFTAAVAKMDKSKPVSVLFRRGELTRFALIRPNP